MHVSTYDGSVSIIASTMFLCGDQSTVYVFDIAAVFVYGDAILEDVSLCE